MKILITGGAGFIGHNLAVRLPIYISGTQIEITVLDNLNRRGAEINLAQLRHHGVRFVHGDLRMPSDLDLDETFDFVIHCGAIPDVSAGILTSPGYPLHTNLTGTIHLLEAMRKKTGNFIDISTSRVYPFDQIARCRFRETATRFEPEPQQPLPGISEHGISEEFPTDGLRSLYGTAKYCSEQVLREFAHWYDLDYVINRCSLVAGPGQLGRASQGIVTYWLAAHILQLPLSYRGYGGSGKQVRDVLHIQDLASLIAMQMQKFHLVSGKIFNVGGGPRNAFSLRELSDLCQQITPYTNEITADPQSSPADVPYFVTDIREIASLLSWQPLHDLPSILHDTHGWIMSNLEFFEEMLR